MTTTSTINKLQTLAKDAKNIAVELKALALVGFLGAVTGIAPFLLYAQCIFK